MFFDRYLPLFNTDIIEISFDAFVHSNEPFLITVHKSIKANFYYVGIE